MTSAFVRNPKRKKDKGKKAFVVLCVFLLCVTLAAIPFVLPCDENVREYRMLSEEVQTRSQDVQGAKPYSATQQRLGVNKDIFFDDDTNGRLHVKILSDSSDLVFNREENGTRIVEKLKGVKFYMQEELFYQTPDGRDVLKLKDGTYVLRSGGVIDSTAAPLIPMQQVRFVEADEASYNFHADSLDALHAIVFRYRLPGHSLPDSFDERDLLMQGDAEKVSLSIVDNRIHFIAEQLKAKYFSPRSGF